MHSFPHVVKLAALCVCAGGAEPPGRRVRARPELPAGIGMRLPSAPRLSFRRPSPRCHASGGRTGAPAVLLGSAQVSGLNRSTSCRLPRSVATFVTAGRCLLTGVRARLNSVQCAAVTRADRICPLFLSAVVLSEGGGVNQCRSQCGWDMDLRSLESIANL